MSNNVLTSAELTAATGEESHDQIVDIELIFTSFDEIGGLENCNNVRNFTAIAGKLKSISNLQPLSATLTRLCLCDQALTKMENLELPMLQQLLLHQNQITTISGLNGCPKLQKLWLYSNKITVMENLHYCADLRELWLQDNNITYVQGLRSLSNLKSVSLAKNQISEFTSIQHLSSVHGLRHLTLSDAHFGENPVVHLSGYRDFIHCHMKQIQYVDGVEVKTSDQSHSEDKYMSQVIQFSDKIETALRSHEQEILAIDSRRNRNSNQSQSLRAELLNAFQALEVVVNEGAARVAREHQRQKDARAKNLSVVTKALEQLQKQYHAEVERELQREATREAEEDELYQILEDRVTIERRHSIFISELQKKAPPGVAFQHLADHSPDWRYVVSQFLSAENTTSPSSCIADLKLLHVYRVFNENSCREFEGLCAAQQKKDVRNELEVSQAGTRTASLFYTGTRDAIEKALMQGVERNAAPTEPLYLFTDPSLAAYYYNDDDDLTSKSGGGDSSTAFDIFQCQVLLPASETIASYDLPTPVVKVEDLRQYHISKGKTGTVFSEVKYSSGRGGTVYVTSVAHAARILPQYNILCVSGCSVDKEDRLDALFQELRMPSFCSDGPEDESKALFNEFEKKAQEEIRIYQDRLQRDLDPDIAAKNKQLETEALNAQKSIQSLRSQIDEERLAQDQLLRNYRNQDQPSGRKR